MSKSKDELIKCLTPEIIADQPSTIEDQSTKISNQIYNLLHYNPNLAGMPNSMS